MDVRTFALTADVSAAHRQVLVAEDDGHCLGCQVLLGDPVYVHTVETFGVASASYFPWADLRGKCVLLAQQSWPTQVIIVITIGTKKSMFVCTIAPRSTGTQVRSVWSLPHSHSLVCRRRTGRVIIVTSPSERNTLDGLFLRCLLISL